MAQPTLPPIDGLETRLCGPGDRALQAELYNRCFKKQVQAEQLAWRYDGNPHGESLSAVLVDDGGRPACGFAYSPRQALRFGEESSRAGIGQQGDVMTDPDFRKRGLASELSKVCGRLTRERGWPFNWGFPNRRSASLFLKVGWESVGVIRPLSFYFRSDGAAKRDRLAEGRLRAALLPLSLRRCRAGLRRLRAADRAGLETRVIDRFPREVLELSLEVEQRFPLMMRRDADYLNWRFVENPSGLHRILGVFDSGGELAGYAVVQLPAEGSAVGYLVDLLAPREEVVGVAIEAALSLLDGVGASVVRATAVDGSWWARTLRGAGFLEPKPEKHLFVYIFVQDQAHPLIGPARDASSWYLTDGDRDDETMG